MTEDEILAILERAGHGAHADAVAALIQPAIRLVGEKLADAPREDDAIDAFDTALDTLPLGASRLGGVPDLPVGMAWPDRDGVPMEFIAQINCAQVASLDPRLPAGGTLLFFYNSQWTSSDNDREARCCAVIHSEAELARATPPRVEWKSEFANEPQTAPYLHGLAQIRFEPTVVVPGGVSPFITEPLSEFWQDFHSEHSSEMAGTDESGHENFLLGYVDEQDYVDAHANGTEDQLLLQVDSDDAADLNFGDCNKLFFLLTKAELAARDFTNVRVYSLLG